MAITGNNVTLVKTLFVTVLDGEVEQASLSVDLSEADSIIQHQLSLRNPCKASLLLTHRHARLQTRTHTRKKKLQMQIFKTDKSTFPLPPRLTHTYLLFFFFLREQERACTLIFVAFNSLRPCWIKHNLSMLPEVDTRASRPSVSLETHCNVSGNSQKDKLQTPR